MLERSIIQQAHCRPWRPKPQHCSSFQSLVLWLRAGDVSTDGRWCFMIFKVTLGQAMPPHWSLLRRRLEAICPTTHGDHSMWRYTSRTRDTQHPFLLQVTSYDRRGFLHGARLWAYQNGHQFSVPT